MISESQITEPLVNELSAAPEYITLEPIEKPSVQTPLEFPTKICKIVFQGFSDTLKTPQIIEDKAVGKELVIYPKYLEGSSSYDPEASLIIFKFNARIEIKLTKNLEIIPGYHQGVPFKLGEEIIFVCPGY